MVLAQLLVSLSVALKSPASSALSCYPRALHSCVFPFIRVLSNESAIHSFAVLRAYLNSTNVNVGELISPYIGTGFNAAHRERNIEEQGGEERVVKPMLLEEYMDGAMAGLKQRDAKEVLLGFPSRALHAASGF